jgi:hypothetical protein
VCRDDALQSEIAGEQYRVRFESRRALGEKTIEHLRGRQELTAEGAFGVAADDELSEPQC